MKFVLVNGRTPRPQSFCALCCEPIGESYLRELTTRLSYCAGCYLNWIPSNCCARVWWDSRKSASIRSAIVVADVSAWWRIVGRAASSARGRAKTHTSVKLHSTEILSVAGLAYGSLAQHKPLAVPPLWVQSMTWSRWSFSQQVWDSEIKYAEAASIDDYFGRILCVGVINIAQTARHKFGQSWHLKRFWRRGPAQLEALSILD